ncbi:hypothetical protein TNCT_18501 [Trichonephila clavata]|uniref:Uncharacterized protein n=1 Tax=Trichonephila clavata TaxID=2740835 RepID=A0A8X6LF25_TRICU|nr:hypothetical protein TNCT_18501 [Trichonephila clavata]
MGNTLAEQCFGSYKDAKKWLLEWFATKREDFYYSGVHKLPERQRKKNYITRIKRRAVCQSVGGSPNKRPSSPPSPSIPEPSFPVPVTTRGNDFYHIFLFDFK